MCPSFTGNETHLCIILIQYTMHVFARKQRILCYALRRKSHLTLPYVTSLRDSFSSLELLRTALLCCRLAASRLREYARRQSSRSTSREAVAVIVFMSEQV